VFSPFLSTPEKRFFSVQPGRKKKYHGGRRRPFSGNGAAFFPAFGRTRRFPDVAIVSGNTARKG